MIIPFSELEFIPLTKDHNLTSFRCQETELHDFLKENALKDQLNRISATRLVYYKGRLVGYFTLVNDCIEVKAIEESDGEPGYPYAKYPAIKIARLATHSDFERRGIGRNMLSKILIVSKDRLR
jgi:GNAT superfamily N-acetyltransferase